ncbi:hypothetical protein DERP_003740 [Dermatophagoides pteronyssinus]|uniref:Uncharacterized protein n=1 Tax=Dermatophagoides pteronyssinus TaxID=6956 RepID=A0ABQ8JMC1_DERPT|nr:hypothetical protein DERP_003740 [Dermatophagoides pteronyssinus]
MISKKIEQQQQQQVRGFFIIVENKFEIGQLKDSSLVNTKQQTTLSSLTGRVQAIHIHQKKK